MSSPMNVGPGTLPHPSPKNKSSGSCQSQSQKNLGLRPSSVMILSIVTKLPVMRELKSGSSGPPHGGLAADHNKVTTTTTNQK